LGSITTATAVTVNTKDLSNERASGVCVLFKLIFIFIGDRMK